MSIFFKNDYNICKNQRALCFSVLFSDSVHYFELLRPSSQSFLTYTERKTTRTLLFVFQQEIKVYLQRVVHLMYKKQYRINNKPLNATAILPDLMTMFYCRFHIVLKNNCKSNTIHMCASLLFEKKNSIIVHSLLENTTKYPFRVYFAPN